MTRSKTGRAAPEKNIEPPWTSMRSRAVYTQNARGRLVGTRGIGASW